MKKRTVLRGHVWMGASLAALGLAVLSRTPAGPLIAKRWKRALQAAWEGNRASVRPNISWNISTPAAHGMDPSKLDALREAARRTTAFLLVRHEQIVYEWYRPGTDANQRRPTAALAKATTGSMALVLALDAGYIQLDDLVAEYVPPWADQPLKADIRIRHLASHSSGIQEVGFLAGEHGQLEGWQKQYYEDGSARFTLALTRAPIEFPPRAEYSYSGTGYYVLATVLATILRNTSFGDVRTLLERRLMQPLEIPEDAWRISHGRKTTIGELDLYAIGSGAQYTARAVARLGSAHVESRDLEGTTDRSARISRCHPRKGPPANPQPRVRLSGTAGCVRLMDESGRFMAFVAMQRFRWCWGEPQRSAGGTRSRPRHGAFRRVSHGHPLRWYILAGVGGTPFCAIDGEPQARLMILLDHIDVTLVDAPESCVLAYRWHHDAPSCPLWGMDGHAVHIPRRTDATAEPWPAGIGQRFGRSWTTADPDQ